MSVHTISHAREHHGRPCRLPPGVTMTLAVNDSDHRRWRDAIEGLVDEWRDVADDDVIDLTAPTFRGPEAG